MKNLRFISKKFFSNKPVSKDTENLYLQALKTLKQTIKDPNALQELQMKPSFNLEAIDNSQINEFVNSYTERPEYLKALIEEEISEDEFASDKEVKFRRPPQSPAELFNVVKSADEIYAKTKETFYETLEESKVRKTDNFLKSIPKHMTINNLKYPVTGASLVMLGVHKFSASHCAFVNSFLQIYEPNLILTQISPDEAFFIKGDADYEESWRDFLINGIDYNFLVNPLPKTISETMLDPDKTKHLLKTIGKSNNFALSTSAIFSKKSKHVTREFSKFRANTWPFPHSVNLLRV